MKAIIALVVIYVGTFLVAIQGASNSSVQAAAQEATAKTASLKSVDPQKDSDIRSLLELIGARDAIQDAATNATEQYRQRLTSVAANDDKAQDAINSYLSVFQNKYDADTIVDQLVVIYDKHYNDDEIKGMLQFFGSPLGQKVATEMPKINKETQLAVRNFSGQAAREAWQEFRADNGALTPNRPLGGRRRWQQGQNQPAANQSAQADSQQP